MAYFRPFSNVIFIKTTRAARKNTSNMAATIGDVMDDVTCKSSIIFTCLDRSLVIVIFRMTAVVTTGKF
jgi:hypothetical protein